MPSPAEETRSDDARPVLGELFVDKPGHPHVREDELHLQHSELIIDARKLYPGDYYRAEPGTSDALVWSETGCTCVLMTSMQDELR